jgi:hypothetical protein
MGVMMAMPFFLLLVVGGGIMQARRRALRAEVERFLDDEAARLAGRAATEGTGEAT